MLEQYIDVLARSELFRGVRREDLPSMLECLEPKQASYDRGQYVTCAGDRFDGLGVLLKGDAVVYKENAAGNRLILTLLGPGDMFGEMIAFSRHRAWPVTVEATEGCEVFYLANMKVVGQCSAMCPWHKTLIMNMLTIVSERALRLNKQVEYFSIKGMRGKISAYLLDEHNITGSNPLTLPMNRTKLADYLGVSRPSMSREMARMRSEGLIDFHLRSVRILDVEALKRVLA